MTISFPRPLTLIILDGFGHREEKEANAIYAASMPHWEKLKATYPHTLISGSGCDVGLPAGQMGNSEVGHLNLGAGRMVHQDLTRIDDAIASGEFFKNSILINALQKAYATGKAVHLLGLISPGGVHSHEAHTHAMLELAHQQKVSAVYVHAFLDGRDTPPRSALSSLQKLDHRCKGYKNTKIASLIGRYYAMDRDKRWDRVAKAYALLVEGDAAYHTASVESGLSLAYERGETDEFVKATAIHPHDQSPVSIADGDVVIFMNFRADRARELTESFISTPFDGFQRPRHPQLGEFVCLSEYDANYPVPIAFPPEPLYQLFGEYISQQGLTQLRIAETEKYAHVTFFFNGGKEAPSIGEDRLLIPSPKIATYDLQPEMSAFILTDRLIESIESGKYNVIICNFANPDMVGHTGDFSATVKALEVIDQCLGKIVETSQKIGGEILITADHGNAECMFDPNTGQPHTAHTSDPVPFLYVGRKATILKNNGKLSDVAPTMLYLLDLPIPPEMTGTSLLKLDG